MILQGKFNSIAEVHNDVLNGTPVFKGTRVSIPLILEYLSKGWSIQDLTSSYPSVKSEYISQLLKMYAEDLMTWKNAETENKKTK